MSASLRPLNTGELLDRTFSLYRTHFMLFFGIVALPHLALLVYQLMGVAILPSRRVMTGVIFGGLWGLGVILISTVVTAASQAATIVAVSQVHLDRAASVLESFSRVKNRILGVIGLSILMGLGIGLGFMLLIVPGILLAMRWSVAVPAKVLENLGASNAMSRSTQLTEGNRWRIFVIWILFLALNLGVGALLQWPITLASAFLTRDVGRSAFMFMQVASIVATFISQCLVGPLATIAFSLVYYDERVRKEAFDIQLMMTTLDGDQIQAVPA